MTGRFPAFGVKLDAVPGRLQSTWFRAEREGIYYGQCSELCGRNHAFMPIAVRVVSEAEFNDWLGKTKAAAAPGHARQVAASAGVTKPLVIAARRSPPTDVTDDQTK